MDPPPSEPPTQPNAQRAQQLSLNQRSAPFCMERRRIRLPRLVRTKLKARNNFVRQKRTLEIRSVGLRFEAVQTLFCAPQENGGSRLPFASWANPTLLLSPPVRLDLPPSTEVGFVRDAAVALAQEVCSSSCEMPNNGRQLIVSDSSEVTKFGET
jgi:hypothetical protein